MSDNGHTTPNNGHTNNTQNRTVFGTDLARTSRNRRVMCGSSSPSSVEVADNTRRELDNPQLANQTSSSTMTPADVIHDALADELAHLCDAPERIHIVGAASAVMRALRDEYPVTYRDGQWFILVPTTPPPVQAAS